MAKSAIQAMRRRRSGALGVSPPGSLVSVEGGVFGRIFQRHVIGWNFVGVDLFLVGVGSLNTANGFRLEVLPFVDQFGYTFAACGIFVRKAHVVSGLAG